MSARPIQWQFSQAILTLSFSTFIYGMSVNYFYFFFFKHSFTPGTEKVKGCLLRLDKDREMYFLTFQTLKYALRRKCFSIVSFKMDMVL